jgi:hypothetical protein
MKIIASRGIHLESFDFSSSSITAVSQSSIQV